MKIYESKNFKKNYENYLLYLLKKGYKLYENKDKAEHACSELLIKLQASDVIVYDECESECKIYNDPDNKKNDKFYSDLSNFLNAARISRNNKKILSFKANEDPYGMITAYYKDKKG